MRGNNWTSWEKYFLITVCMNWWHDKENKALNLFYSPFIRWKEIPLQTVTKISSLVFVIPPFLEAPVKFTVNSVTILLKLCPSKYELQQEMTKVKIILVICFFKVHYVHERKDVVFSLHSKEKTHLVFSALSYTTLGLIKIPWK